MVDAVRSARRRSTRGARSSSRRRAGSGKTGLLIQRFLRLLATVERARGDPRHHVSHAQGRGRDAPARARGARAGRGPGARPTTDNERKTWQLAPRRAGARPRARLAARAQRRAPAHPHDRRALRLARAPDAGVAPRRGTRHRRGPPGALQGSGRTHAGADRAGRGRGRARAGRPTPPRWRLVGRARAAQDAERRHPAGLATCRGFHRRRRARAALEQSFRAERRAPRRRARASCRTPKGPRSRGSRGTPPRTARRARREPRSQAACGAEGLSRARRGVSRNGARWRRSSSWPANPHAARRPKKLVGFPAGDGVARAFKVQMRPLARLPAIDGLDEVLHSLCAACRRRLTTRMGNAGGQMAHPAARGGRAAAGLRRARRDRFPGSRPGRGDRAGRGRTRPPACCLPWTCGSRPAGR